MKASARAVVGIPLMHAAGPDWDAIPMLLQQGLRNYFEHRLTPGSFLRACLTNDAMRAVGYADPDSMQAIPCILRWLAMYAPGGTFGDEETVSKWTGIKQ